MKIKIQTTITTLFCSLWLLTCTPSDPPLKSVDSTNTYKLLTYTYDYKETRPTVPPPAIEWDHQYGNEVNRINPIGLSIKRAYTTSDGVDHVVLRGKIKSGIPLGLSYDLDNNVYQGRGDFEQHWGTVLGLPTVDDDDELLLKYEEAIEAVYHPASGGGITEDTTVGSTGTHGSAEAYKYNTGTTNYYTRRIFDGVELSMEYRYKGGYAAVTLSGIIDNALVSGDTTIVEVNDSLRLYSEGYRKAHYPDYATFFTTDAWYRTKVLKNNPNYFAPRDSDKLSQPRDGYSFLISEAADPKQATFEVKYGDGTKHTVVVDYSEVEFIKKPLAKDTATPPTLNKGIVIYNNTDDPFTANFFNSTSGTPPIVLSPPTGGTVANGGPVILDNEKARLWFNWIPYDSTCRIKSIEADRDNVKIEWDDELETIKISSSTGGTISGARITLNLSQPYYYGTASPAAYIDTIILTLTT